MNIVFPAYWLLTSVDSLDDGTDGGRWQFVLQRRGSSDRLVASDIETGCSPERIQLLAVVRGLEALEQPSDVTLVTGSRFVGRGIRSGLADWKESNWRWERFGEMIEINNCDLWKRIDHAMQIHSVECRYWVSANRGTTGLERRPGLRRARIRTKVAEWSDAFSAGISRLAKAGCAANI